MVFRSALAACSLAACFSLCSPAQSTSSQPQPSAPQQPAPSQPAPQDQPKLQFQDLPPEPRTPTPEEAEQQHQQAVLNAAVRLVAMQAHWGPELGTPGLSMALRELRRAKTAEGTSITYRITGSGFAPDDRLMLVRWPLNSEAQATMGGISFDAKGVAVCGEAPAQAATPAAAGSPDASSQAAAPASGLSAAPAPNAVKSAPPTFTPPPTCATTMQQNQPVEIQTTAAPGEAIRVAFMSTDRKRIAAVSTIPFPVANSDKGCRLQVILGVKDGSLVLIDGTGFPPNTPLKLDAVTGGTTRPLHPRTNAEGRILVPLLVGTKGQTSGDTTVRFAGLNRQPTLDTPKEAAQPDPDCAPAVSFHWGEGSYKPE
jgi:hypothetical protein